MESRYLLISANTVDEKGKSVFIPLKGNRKFKASPYLIKSLKEDGQVYPVICFEKNSGYYLVVDGQHRLDGLKQLNRMIELKVYRKTDPSENELEFIDKLIRSANSTSKNWTNKDHLVWNSQFNSDPVYKRFYDLNQKYKNLEINFLHTALKKSDILINSVNKYIKERTLTFDMCIDEQMLSEIDSVTQLVKEFNKKVRNLTVDKRDINFAVYKYYRLGNYNREFVLDQLFNESSIPFMNNYNLIYSYLIENVK